jgi:ABC-type Fe3+ transport system permease subunit
MFFPVFWCPFKLCTATFPPDFLSDILTTIIISTAAAITTITTTTMSAKKRNR